MNNIKTFDELVQIADNNLKQIEQKEKNPKTRKEKIKNFWKMLFEWIQNISLSWNSFDISINKQYIQENILLWEYTKWLSSIQIDAVMLARDIQSALNSTKWIFTDTDAIKMIIEKDRIYNTYKKQFETNKIQLQ